MTLNSHSNRKATFYVKLKIPFKQQDLKHVSPLSFVQFKRNLFAFLLKTRNAYQSRCLFPSIIIIFVSILIRQYHNLSGERDKQVSILRNYEYLDSFNTKSSTPFTQLRGSKDSTITKRGSAQAPPSFKILLQFYNSSFDNFSFLLITYQDNYLLYTKHDANYFVYINLMTQQSNIPLLAQKIKLRKIRNFNITQLKTGRAKNEADHFNFKVSYLLVLTVFLKIQRLELLPEHISTP